MSLFCLSEETLIVNSFLEEEAAGVLQCLKKGVCFHANLCDIVYSVLVPHFFVNNDTKSSPLPLSLTAIPLYLK